MTLLLAAADEGSTTAIFGVTDLPALSRALALPDDVLFVAVVAAGYPVKADDQASRDASVSTRRRKARDEVVRWERW